MTPQEKDKFVRHKWRFVANHEIDNEWRCRGCGAVVFRHGKPHASPKRIHLFQFRISMNCLDQRLLSVAEVLNT